MPYSSVLQSTRGPPARPAGAQAWAARRPRGPGGWPALSLEGHNLGLWLGWAHDRQGREREGGWERTCVSAEPPPRPSHRAAIDVRAASARRTPAAPDTRPRSPLPPPCLFSTWLSVTVTVTRVRMNSRLQGGKVPGNTSQRGRWAYDVTSILHESGLAASGTPMGR